MRKKCHLSVVCFIVKIHCLHTLASVIILRDRCLHVKQDSV